MAEAGVIERPLCLGHGHGNTAQAGDKRSRACLCHGIRAGDGKAGAGHARGFGHGIAGEGHHRVDRGDIRPVQGFQHGDAAGAADMRHQWAMGGGLRGQLRHHLGERSVGHRDQDSVAGIEQRHGRRHGQTARGSASALQRLW